jgi:Domain of unknown function (DUF4259)
MGTWGAGNFDDDTAADHLSELVGRLLREIEEAFSEPEQLEPDEYWGVAVPCNIELLVLIAQKKYVGCTLPALDVLTNWRDTYMRVWENSIDGLEPTPEFKAQRRQVLTETFDSLIALAAEESAAD